ncbi:MAG: family 78 glycoside hydrolase catalytic domain [Clostridia bacterium]|nr:family 78 glycoside hydrolase catalytic domain [Clostridia bacterium]
MEHWFQGKWISNEIMANLQPRNVFHRQLDKCDIDCSQHRNQHILFRKTFVIDRFQNARIYISADDYYKLYINGRFVAQGPAPSYHFRYNYNEIDVSDYLTVGENTIALHTLYQGLINRVWQSGDGRHGMICDLVADEKTVLVSDESFLTANHTGYTELGVTGKHQTQFLERYDARAAEVGFERSDFDDSAWKNAHVCRFNDHTMTEQKSHILEFETIEPKKINQNGSRILYDFGANYVGYLCVTAKGNEGDRILIRHGQELEEDGSLRFDLRANCKYEEDWTLSDGSCKLDQFDYKVFRYAELMIPDSVELSDIFLCARHYPFSLKMPLKKEYAQNADLQRIWNLCIHTQKYGVQEVI